MFDQIEEAARSRQPDYPPEQSAAGTNTVTVKGCKAVGYTPGYCVCLNKIKAFERDRALASYPECERAISDKSCVALGMRQRERDAGKALFFVDRTLLREEMDKRFGSMGIPESRPVVSSPVTRPAPAQTRVATPKPAPERIRTPEPEVDGYAAAINAAIKEASATPAPVVTKPEPKVDSPSPSPVKKGLSILEMARIKMGKSPSGE